MTSISSEKVKPASIGLWGVLELPNSEKLNKYFGGKLVPNVSIPIIGGHHTCLIDL